MQDWLKFEYHSIFHLQYIFPDYPVFHWSNVPEDLLFDIGFIHNFNEHRLKRSLNIGNKIQDSGFDGIMTNSNNDYHVLQMKY